MKIEQKDFWRDIRIWEKFNNKDSIMVLIILVLLSSIIFLFDYLHSQRVLFYCKVENLILQTDFSSLLWIPLKTQLQNIQTLEN